MNVGGKGDSSDLGGFQVKISTYKWIFSTKHIGLKVPGSEYVNFPKQGGDLLIEFAAKKMLYLAVYFRTGNSDLADKMVIAGKKNFVYFLSLKIIFTQLHRIFGEHYRGNTIAQ